MRAKQGSPVFNALGIGYHRAERGCRIRSAVPVHSRVEASRRREANRDGEYCCGEWPPIPKNDASKVGTHHQKRGCFCIRMFCARAHESASVRTWKPGQLEPERRRPMAGRPALPVPSTQRGDSQGSVATAASSRRGVKRECVRQRVTRPEASCSKE